MGIGNWLIGVACSSGSASSSTNPAALFTPNPSATYLITPNINFWISWGDYTANQMVDVSERGTNPRLIQFTAMGTNKATVLHDASGNLVIES